MTENSKEYVKEFDEDFAELVIMRTDRQNKEGYLKQENELQGTLKVLLEKAKEDTITNDDVFDTFLEFITFVEIRAYKTGLKDGICLIKE
jgi:hypothetical protein